MIRGSAAVFLGEAYSNLVRLLGNLVLTRLLYPEAFGLMLIVTLVLMVLGQLSDVGVKGAIVARQGTVDDAYIDTAWTMLVARGVLLGVITVLLSYPISVLYGEPQLFGLLLLTSVVPVILSLGSPYPMIYERDVRPTRAIVMGAIASTAALAITIIWLLLSPSIWALAANGIFSSLFGLVLSYKLYRYRVPRLRWDRQVVRQIFSFGRWIVLGTALTYLARQGDRIIVSRAVSIEMLGVYSIAVNFSGLIDMIVGKLNYTVLFPVYSELRTRGNDQVLAKLRKIKLAVYGLCLPLITILAVFGRDLILWLYDPRYHEAGWMLEVLAAGTTFFVAGSVLHTLPLAFGDSFRHMWRQGLSLASLLVCMLSGASLFGFPGLIIGVGVAHLVDYVVIRIAVRKYGIREGRADMAFVLITATLILSGWSMRGWPWLE